MTRAKSSIVVQAGAILVRRERAAALLDLSAGTFDALVAEGVLPPGRLLGASRFWLVDDLRDAAHSLPTASGGGSSWSGVEIDP